VNDNKLHIAFLWHMHQPYYKTLKENRFQMPWVRLHGIKDYYDMVAILDDFPKIKQTFNLVPSLVEQIEEYTERGCSDRHLELSRKSVEDLTPHEKTEILSSFFSAHFPTMIQPFTRYRSLREKSARKGVKSFSKQDILDLQVWSNLVWFDPIFRNDGIVSQLFAKGEGFSEGEKQELLNKQIEIMRMIVPKYKEVQDRGQIEVSISPYYHPILPLLYDTNIAKESNPNINLPKNRFRHPEDAEQHIKAAIEFYRKRFGKLPKGMWPSEGSVSEDIIPLISKAGIKWVASDEEILALSLGRSADRREANNVSATTELYQPYLVGERENQISIIFRDHTLSDRIGFVYANWDPQKAADDFVDKLLGLKLHLGKTNPKNNFIPIILDGENAWEYYHNDGRDFLKALYAKLSAQPDIETTTVSEYLESFPPNKKIQKLFPGSWINHNFDIWIGHSEDNHAWDSLFAARSALLEFQNSAKGRGYDKDKIAQAWNEIYIAEGSDWCWWFGDEHQSPNNDKFDSLFRSNLTYIYELLELSPPTDLLKPIRTIPYRTNIIYPTGYLTPVIDGRNTNFYEWYSAGYYDCAKAGNTMHRSIYYIRKIYFGFDKNNLYIRIDPDPSLAKNIFLEIVFNIEFFTPVKSTITLNYKNKSIEINPPSPMKPNVKITAEIDSFLEMAIPMEFFPTDDFLALQFDFRVIISHNGKELEIWPPVDLISFKLPKASPDSIFW